MPNFLSISTSSPKRSHRRASDSPTTVTTILNSMYASRPSRTQDTQMFASDSNSGEGSSQGHYNLRRTTSHEERAQVKAPRISSRPKTSASGGSRSASRRFAASPTPSSIMDQRQQLSPADSRVSDGSAAASTSSSSLRLVGRGGSGSKYRAVGPKPPTLGTNNQPLPTDPANIASAVPPPSAAAPTFYRPSGRGGMGARKKSLDTPPVAILDRLDKFPLRKVLSTKFRKDSSSGRSVRSQDSIPEDSASPQDASPHRRFYTSTGSFSTFDTNSSDGIQYSPRSSECAHEELDEYLPPLSASSSTFEDASICATPASDQNTASFAKLAKLLGELPPNEIYDNLYRNQHLMHAPPVRQDSITGDVSQDVKMSRRSSLSASITSIFSPIRYRGSTASQHTLSTTADGLHPGSIADDVSDSWGRNSVTPVESDFDTQSNLRCETPESPILFSAPSPEPVPTLQVKEKTRHSHLTITTALEELALGGGGPTPKPIPSIEVDTSTLDPIDSPSTECAPSPSSSPTTPISALHRSNSYSHGMRRSIIRPSHSVSVSLGVEGLNAHVNVIDHDYDSRRDASLPPTPASANDTREQPHGRLPELAHWLKPPNAPADAYESKMVFSLGNNPPATMQTWSGEWNTDMQDVIRALRLLR